MSLKNHWYIAATEAAVRKKPQAVQIFGQHYVVFHTQNNQYAALLDCCPHRNVPLSGGKAISGNIECPYHGWQFDGAGKLAHIPATPSCCHDVHIPTAHAIAQDGYVWLCIGEPARKKPLPFPHLNEAGWTTFRMNKHFHAPVAQCLENFLDCPHAVYVHRGLFRSPTRQAMQAELRYLDDGAEVEYHGEPRQQSVVWDTLQNSHTQMRHTDRFIAPNTSRVDYIFSDSKHYIITSSCTPINDNETQVHTVISYKYGKLAPLIRLFFQPLSHIIIGQDIKMLKRQHDTIQRFGGKPRFYRSQADLLLPAIEAWRKALDENTAPPEAGKSEMRELFL